MGQDFLGKIRRLNWVLSESTTGNLSYKDLSQILSEIVNANVYVLDNLGRVLGVAYTDEKDTSTYEDESGFEKVSEQHNDKFLAFSDSVINLRGDDLIPVLGDGYAMKDKYHTIIPSVCGGQRLGTILLARYENSFDDEEIAMGEYGAAVVGLEIQRNNQLEKTKQKNLKMAVEMALDTLSFSERDALDKVLEQLKEDEGLIVASKIANEFKLTNSVIVSALKKMESAGILEVKSLGMKGTWIKVKNPYLRKVTALK